jgi:cytochrome c biogenesis protein
MSVNDPLRYGGFTMYQTDWGISAMQVHVDGEGPFNLVAATLQSGDSKLFGTFLPIGDTGSNEAPKGMSVKILTIFVRKYMC